MGRRVADCVLGTWAIAGGADRASAAIPSAPEVQEKSEHEEEGEAEDARDDNTDELALGEPSHGCGPRGVAGCC